ncbi:heparinase II/III domain-containing protein [Microlunatus speluncae]|uniref:heparinase II/III domain-containing protein n=1 Tax=Microlunatus speluncae TaxID=2594267 RepID=UPI00126665B2|nr:heparinase II/III family protein [Microlunatus speluncae]
MTVITTGPEKPRHIDDRITRLSDDDLIAAFGRPDGVGDVAALRAWLAGRQRRVARPLPEWAESVRGTTAAEAIIGAADALLEDDFDVTGAELGRSQRYGWHYLGWLSGGIKAWLLTGDQDRLRAVERHLVRWAETRDSVIGEWPGLDVIWYSLGTWARCHNLLPALEALTPTELSDRAWRELVATLIGGARWAYDEHDRFRHGNWQLVSATQLIQLAAVLPDLVEAPSWARRGRDRLLEHLELDVYPDGGHYERSPGYHVMCLEAVQLAATVDLLYGDGELARQPRVRAMHDWLVTLTGSGGWIPHLQDSGVIWPADLLRRGAELLAAPDLAAAADDPHGSGRPPVEVLPDSGYVVLRGADDQRIVVNVGPHIEHELESHSHRAVLDLVLDGRSRPLLSEAGGPTSYDVPDYLTWYQAGRGHNTVTVDDLELGVDRGARLIGSWDAGPVVALSAEHCGYGPVQQRDVIMTRQEPTVIMVRDRAEDDEATHRFSCHWHAVEPWQPVDAAFRSGSAGEPGLLLTVLAEPGDQPEQLSEDLARRPDPATRTAEHAPLYGLTLERAHGRFTTVIRTGPDAAALDLAAAQGPDGIVVRTAGVIDTVGPSSWIRRGSDGALHWATAWNGTDLVVPEFAVQQRDPHAATLSTIQAVRSLSLSKRRPEPVEGGQGDVVCPSTSSGNDGVIIDIVSNGRADLRLNGLRAEPELRLNDIPIAAESEDDVIMVGLPMAGRWTITGLAL